MEAPRVSMGTGDSPRKERQKLNPGTDADLFLLIFYIILELLCIVLVDSFMYGFQKVYTRKNSWSFHFGAINMFLSNIQFNYFAKCKKYIPC